MTRKVHFVISVQSLERFFKKKKTKGKLTKKKSQKVSCFFLIGVWQIVFLHRKETLTRRKSLNKKEKLNECFFFPFHTVKIIQLHI